MQKLKGKRQKAKGKRQKEEPGTPPVTAAPAVVPDLLPFTFCHLPFAFLPSLLLLVLCAFLFFYRLGDADLHASHEARAAMNAQTLRTDRAWGLPKLYDRRPELQKPPLFYWLVAAVAALHGGTVTAWDVRLPAALAGLGCVLLLVLLGARRGRPLAGFAAAVGLATMLHFTWLARVGRIDMPLTLTVSLALAGFWLGQCRQREHGGGAWPWFLLAYVAVAAGLLLKGPIAAVLPAAVVGLHLVVERGLRARRPLGAMLSRPPLSAPARPELPGAAKAWHPVDPPVTLSPCHLVTWSSLLWGVPLVLALAGPWFIAANGWTGGELVRVFFWYHNVERGFGGTGGLPAYPWWYYGPRLLLDLLPWSLLLPPALWFFGRGGRWRDDPEARFGLTWLAAVLVLLSCMRFKRADYLLPAYPGAALFLGCVAERWYREKTANRDPQTATRLRRLVLGPLFAVLGCAVAGWWFFLDVVRPGETAGRPQRQFAEAVRRQAPRPHPVLFFRAEDHAVAFHVGRPLTTVLEWENLETWARRRGTAYVLMAPEYAAAWPRHLKTVRLEEVLRSDAFGAAGGGWFSRFEGGSRADRPLVLLRSHLLAPEASRHAAGQPDPGGRTPP
jgi:4-amino-4-deoxy-L-arabinose transferase-like glycosyltransferase